MDRAVESDQKEKSGFFRGKRARLLLKLYAGGTILFWPLTDLAMRFFVALHYLRSGFVKAADWDTAVLLATQEYPVSWMSPEAAAATGLAIELIAPVLLLFGFLTRPAAFALAILTIVAQSVYIPTTTNLMLIAILIWYVACGPAALSLDRLWVSTLRPKAGAILSFTMLLGGWLRKRSAPLLLLAMRIWLGTALLALADVFEPSIALATWLPITSFSGLPPWLAITFAVLLFVGAGASFVSYALTFVIGYFMLAGAHPDVTFYPILLLAVYESRGAGLLSVDQWVEKWIDTKFLCDPDGEDDDSVPVTLVVWAGSLWHFLSGEGRRASP